ncbi:uncharacterized protein LOC108110030 isoform X2 [Drosophila eugracilis]|uniref:uncharacterized protein LOC108110030 isoform X2 n=1 Tax=Drosophila eugracilis TaxID=29029 RepID=UPI0007E81BCB|nr:uncharacterized protein LOC108110030 isoform X2 [Drosophila eugracilis]
MNFGWIQLALISIGISISIHDASSQPERYDRLPSYSQINAGGGGGLDPAHREDLCSHCFCTNIRAFCDYKLNKTLPNNFNDQLLVPLNIKYIEVRLSDYIQFAMYENFFQDNQVNYFGVFGVRRDDQVEITSNAFSHNKGGYPSIEIRNVSRCFFREKSLTGAEYKLLVEDVDKLTVFSNALQMTNLDCSFKRISQLTLMKNAFNPGVAKYGINLRVEDSKTDQLGIFGVSMGKVSLLRCTIGTIKSNAFGVISIKELYIDDCTIAVIEAQALTNKLHSDMVAIRDTVIGTIEGQAISQSGITTMIMVRNKIQRIQPYAIRLVAVSLSICNNSISHVENNWLSVSQADHVEIENNRFQNYGRVELNINPTNCSFRNNILQNPQSGSLNFTCRIHQVYVGHECSCNKSWLTELTDHDLESDVMCQVTERHSGCINATSTDVRRYYNEACTGNITRYCISGQWVTKSASDQLSDSGKYTITSIALLIVVVTVLVIVLVGFIKCLRNGGSGHGDVNGDVCHLEEDIRLALQLKASELHASDQTHNMPQKSSPIESLMFKHIFQCHANANGNPTIDDAYASTTTTTASAACNPTAPSLNASEGGFDDEPIYQEPDQQRPLICGDYSSPLHPVEDTYSEPFNATNANDMPPAYQYATPMRILTPPQQQQQQQQPSTMASYATPVWRSTPSATPTSRPPSGTPGPMATATAPRAVKDLRQALQNSPQFHPNQLTSARNQRQILQTLPAQPPPYSHRPQGHKGHHQRRQSFECLDGAASLAAMEHMDSGSDHSGGSDVTVQIADVIDYADA